MPVRHENWPLSLSKRLNRKAELPQRIALSALYITVVPLPSCLKKLNLNLCPPIRVHRPHEKQSFSYEFRHFGKATYLMLSLSMLRSLCSLSVEENAVVKHLLAHASESVQSSQMKLFGVMLLIETMGPLNGNHHWHFYVICLFFLANGCTKTISVMSVFAAYWT